MQSAQLTKHPSDVLVILLAFLPGEDLINAEKQIPCVLWRGCCGVRTVAHWTHPPGGRKRRCGREKKSKKIRKHKQKKANRSHGRVSLTPPWTCDLTFRLLPITSARHLAHIPQSAHAHVALCSLGGEPGNCEGGGVLFTEGSKGWTPPRSQGNYKEVWTLPAVNKLNMSGMKSFFFFFFSILSFFGGRI